MRRCSVWSRQDVYVAYWKMPKIGQVWRPVAPQPYVVLKSWAGPSKLPGPLTTTWSKQYLSTVHPVTCSLLWVRCLFDRLSISDFPVPASGLWSGSGSKVDKFIHVPTPVDTQTFIQIHARVFELLTDRETNLTGKCIYLLLRRR